MKTRSVRGIDMINGPLLPGILRFALPLALSSVLQLAFNAADMIVLGQFAGKTALAAVGATGALINLIVNLFAGLSVGVNVIVANKMGAKQHQEISDTVHTAMITALLGGVGLLLIGILFADTFLVLMGTPTDVISQSSVYMRVYFAGMPFLMIYNFGSAVLRATGDTKRPLYYLSLAGVLNVVLNLFFVIVLHMDVAGVALATILSQGVSAALIVLCLMRTEGCCQLVPAKLKIHKGILLQMLRIGMPAGLQGCLFSLSNVLIQSAINSFGSVVMSANTAAGNIEGFLGVLVNAMHQAALNFIGQNYGAHNTKRIDKAMTYSALIAVIMSLTVGILAYLFGRPLLRLYTDDPAVIEYGLIRMRIMFTLYFLGGLMDVSCGAMRGLGYSFLPMMVSLAGICGFRILWLYTVFAWDPTLSTLYLSYPISWGLTAAAHFGCFLYVRKHKLHT